MPTGDGTGGARGGWNRGRNRGRRRGRAKQLRLETEGDPDPLPAPYDYETQAKVGFYAGWLFGAAAWAVTVVLLLFAGPTGPWVLGPVVGTTAVVAGRVELAHARVMDARRGGPTTARD